MKVMGLLLAFFFNCYGIGWFFFRVLAYLEGRPVLPRQARRVCSAPVSLLIACFTVWFQRGVVGFGTHPVAEAACGLIFAALAACAISAVGLARGAARSAARKRVRALQHRTYVQQEHARPAA